MTRNQRTGERCPKPCSLCRSGGLANLEFGHFCDSRMDLEVEGLT